MENKKGYEGHGKVLSLTDSRDKSLNMNIQIDEFLGDPPFCHRNLLSSSLQGMGRKQMFEVEGIQ